MAAATIRRNDGTEYSIDGGTNIVARKLAGVLSRNEGTLKCHYPKELASMVHQLMTVNDVTVNEEPLLLPVMNFGPCVDAQPAMVGNVDDNILPLPTMHFGTNDARVLPANGNHVPPRHNAAGGQQGGETPLLLPTMQF